MSNKTHYIKTIDDVENVDLDDVEFTVNNRKVTVPTDTPSNTSLNEFLRTNLLLTGTKVMCREGGCGACVVSITRPDPVEPTKLLKMSVNSCLTPVLSCRNWHITTIEGIGSSQMPHVIQQRVATYNATQCGYCTPGFCMQQYALMQQHPDDATRKRTEDAYDGNICRCTGYRPILDAMKSLATDQAGVADDNDGNKASGRENVKDIEDLAHFVNQMKSNENKTNTAFVFRPAGGFEPGGDSPWFAPSTLEQLWQISPTYSGKKMLFVGGYTGEGVYRDGPYDAYIDIKGMKALAYTTITAERMEYGSLTTLTTLIDLLNEGAQKMPDGFAYLAKISEHIRGVANISVRNAGTWAGNLMLKKNHGDFPSDLFVLFTAAGAQVVLTGISGDDEPISVEKFMSKSTSMENKILKSLILIPLPADTYFASFKVTPREVNAHAHVNAAMTMKLNNATNTGVIVGKPTLIFGNISSDFVHASATENMLGSGQISLASWNSSDGNNTIMKAFDTLREEVKPSMEDPANVSVEYRKSLCVGILYKFLLGAAKHCKIAINAQHESAMGRIDRPLSSGMQSFGTDNAQWPVTQPIPKIEALIQATGEAKFVSDLTASPQAAGTCLHAVPIVAQTGPATLDSIDTSKAERIAGYVRLVVAADIPGKNNALGQNDMGTGKQPQKLFAQDGQIEYAGQLIGFVLADTEHAARAAAAAVKVHTTQTRAPILTVEDAIEAKSFYPLPLPDVVRGDADAAIKASPHIYKGKVRFGSQYHFYMETQVALCEPQDNGTLVLYAGTQWPDLVQQGVAGVCGLNASDVDVHVQRLGGGFGGKVAYQNFISCMVALGAKLTKRSVKMHLNMYDNTRMFFGGRQAYLFHYEVGVSDDKKLQGIKLTSYCNNGASMNDYPRTFQENGDNVYKCPNWFIHEVVCRTDTPPKTYTRAPGSTEAVFIMEHIMERCAFELGMDPLEFRQLNFFAKTDVSLHKHPMTNFNIPEILLELQNQAELSARKMQISTFNSANKWKKRALSVVPLQYSHGYALFNYASLVNVHHGDGTVSVTVGAIDMGQGLNTKVVQCVARELNVDMDKVRIKVTSSFVAGNGFVSAGGVPSEVAVCSTIEACKVINSRMMPVREKLGEKATWQQIVDQCYKQGIDMAERNWMVGKKLQALEQKGDAYEICSVMATEIELDILTGERQIRRIDVVYDNGKSISPAIDIGQAEGAIVMGLGLYTSEQEKRNKQTGELLTYNTCHYKPPSAKDIPVDMRVTFLQGVPNRLGALSSKTVSLPPLNMACSVLFALRQAVDEARRSAAESGKITWIEMDAPATCEQVHLSCDVKNAQFKM